jgi:hypothetical protein
MNRRFGGTYHVHLPAYPPAACCFPRWLIFDPKDGVDTFLRNPEDGSIHYTKQFTALWTIPNVLLFQ